jgi:hypothetical protein
LVVLVEVIVVVVVIVVVTGAGPTFLAREIMSL